MSLIDDEMPFKLTLIWNLKISFQAGTSRKFCHDFRNVLKVIDGQIVTESTENRHCNISGTTRWLPHNLNFEDINKN